MENWRDSNCSVVLISGSVAAYAVLSTLGGGICAA